MEEGKPMGTLDGLPLDAAETMAKMDAFILSVSKLFPSPLAPLLLLQSPLTPPIYNNK